MKLLETLENKVLIADGAMGTVLYSKFGISYAFESLNLTNKEDIVNIHKAYINAGADVIQTNTYAANRLKLSRYGLENKIADINNSAIELAKKAIQSYEKNIFLLGAMGGIVGAINSQLQPNSPDEIDENFEEQLKILVNTKSLDALLLETYYDLDELKRALKIARKHTNLPIIASLTMYEVGFLQDGTKLFDALQALKQYGANIVGVNCRLGPYHMAQSLENIPIDRDFYLSVFPNASLPEISFGEVLYKNQGEYFASYAEIFRLEGARLIGGCCGTTPEHISALRKGLKDTTPVNFKEIKKQNIFNINNFQSHAKYNFLENYKTQKQCLVELDPPKSLDTKRFFEGAIALRDMKVTAITIADNSLATSRISNLALAAKLIYEHDIMPMLHLTARDMNLIGLHSHIMGLFSLGVENILVITGDPSKFGDFPGATSVYDIRSSGLIKIIKKFNQGIAPTGLNLEHKTRFCVAAALNININSVKKLLPLIKRKIDCGADYLITQPVYDLSKIKELKDLLVENNIEIPVFIGVLPLVTCKNAHFLHNEVPGIKLSNEVLEKMSNAQNKKIELEQGIKIAKEIIDEIYLYFNGIHLVTPFQKYQISVELLEYIQKKYLFNI